LCRGPVIWLNLRFKISKEGIADNSVGKKPVRALFLRVSMVSDWRADISAGRVPANPASGTFMVVTDPELPSHVTPAQVQQLAQAALIQEFISEDCEF